MKTLTKFFILCSLFTSTICVAASTEIDIYTWRSQEGVLWNKINERGLIPGVKVNIKALKYESYVPHLILNLQNNTADMFQWAPGASSLKQLIEHKFIEPFDGDLSNINTSALLASKGPDSQYYGVPFALQLQSLVVNKKLVNKYGFNKQPSSMSELASVFSTLKKNDIAPVHIAGSESWYLNQLVGEVLLAGIVEEEVAQKLIDGEACFTEPEYLETLNVLHDWLTNGDLNANVAEESYGGISDSVSLGNSAMAIDGGWRTNPTSTFFKIDPEFQFYFWSIPGKANKVYALGDGSYQVNSNSPKAEAAKKVLRFTATRRFAELFAEHVKELPAYGGEMNISDPMLNRLSGIVANAYEVSLFNSYEINQKEPSYRTLVMTGYKDLFNKRKTPKQISEDIQTGLNSWGYPGTNLCQ